jgi:Zn-dependent peptidase ImmA (M78 family)/predicted secreted protein
MSSYTERRAARLRGSGEAIRQAVALRVDPGEAIDVFRAIERQRVWLLFEPLDRLYGMFRREGDAAGIVLHSGHPLSVQRFTAAHELGHHALGHQFSRDSTSELFGGDAALQEIEAQAFAAEFLMPLSLVNRAQDRLGLDRTPAQLTPIEAYQLSLEMGSSYTATVNQLVQLNKITDTQRTELEAWKPMDLKIELGNGTRPAHARADVWDVTAARRGRKVRLRLADELHLRLPELPATGYRWDVGLAAADTGLEVVADELEPAGLAANERIGADRLRHVWWRAVAPVETTLELRLVRPWEGPGAAAADAFSVPLAVETPRTGLQVSAGLSEPQRRAMLQQAA